MTKTSAQLAAISSAAAMLTAALPWAKYDDKNPDDRVLQIKVDGPKAYAEWFRLLEGDQYWLEVVAQCIKLDVGRVLAGSALDPRTSGEVLQIDVSRAEDYAQAGKPRGRGPEAASKGYEARAHFGLVRGKDALHAATA
jgi:hypothetical protein